MTGVSNALGAMNKQMNVPQLRKIMVEFEKNNERAEAQQEMLDDEMDGVFDDDVEEEQIVGQVLAEIGIDLGGAAPVAPTSDLTQPAVAAAVPPAAAAVPAAAAGGGLPPAAGPPGGGDAGAVQAAAAAVRAAAAAAAAAFLASGTLGKSTPA